MIDVEALHVRLCQERAEILNRAKPQAELARGDEADLALMAQHKEREMWLAIDAQQRLAAIERTIRRIENGKYGLCENCGKPILEERLAAMPLTLYDVQCQSQIEKRNKR